MPLKHSISEIAIPTMKPQVYAVQSEQFTFAEILTLIQKKIGYYPGTLLKNPIAFEHLTIIENILLAYSIAYPKKRNKEQEVIDLLESNDIDVDYISNQRFDSLSLHTSLNLQLCIHYLCNTKVILVGDWVNQLEAYELKSIILLLKNICHKQEITVLINTNDEKVQEYCDNVLRLDK